MEKRNVVDPSITPDYAKQAEADVEEFEQVRLFGECCGKRGDGDCACKEKSCAPATT